MKKQYKLMFGFIKKMFMGLLTDTVSGSSP